MKHLAILAVLACCSVAVTPSALARPRVVCGGQYAGTPYLDCQSEEGREAIPQMCTRYYRNCNGQQVHLSTMCVAPTRGSSEHRFLNALCTSLGAYDRLDGAEGADETTLPYDFDADLLMSSDKLAPVQTLPDVTSFDFPNDGIKGPVPAHRHPNGLGIVADSVTFTDPKSAFVGPEAMVYGHAVIGEGVFILGKAQVYDDAFVTDNAFVGDEAHVFGASVVRDYAGVLGRAEVSGEASVECGGIVTDDALVSGMATVDGYDFSAPELECADAWMSVEPAIVGGKVELWDDTFVTSGMELLTKP